MEIVKTHHAPPAIGPYSQAVVVHESCDLIFCSGQIALSPDNPSAQITSGVAEQTEQVMENLAAVLREAGCSLDDIVKVTVFLTDLSDFSVVNEAYGQFFSDYPPARSTVGVNELPRGAAVEIEATAIRSLASELRSVA